MKYIIPELYKHQNVVDRSNTYTSTGQNRSATLHSNSGIIVRVNSTSDQRCVQCGHDGKIYAKGKCSKCYFRDYQRKRRGYRGTESQNIDYTQPWTVCHRCGRKGHIILDPQPLKPRSRMFWGISENGYGEVRRYPKGVRFVRISYIVVRVGHYRKGNKKRTCYIMAIPIDATTTAPDILEKIISKWFSLTEFFKHDKHNPQAIPDGAWRLDHCGVPFSVLRDRTRWKNAVMYKVEKALSVIVKREQLRKERSEKRRRKDKA